LLAGCAALLAVTRPAPAQTYVPTSSLPPVILLDAYIDYPALLLTLPSGFDLLSPSRRSRGEGRMHAYRDFQRALQLRTAGVVGMPASREARGRARREMLAAVGQHLAELPGAAMFRQGRFVWQRIEDSTDFDVEGFRVRLRMDEAVEGKLALKVQKQLR
jgi:hypothetical protein